MKIKCVKCDCENGMFSAGTMYRIKDNGCVDDDLGHERFIPTLVKRFIIRNTHTTSTVLGIQTGKVYYARFVECP